MIVEITHHKSEITRENGFLSIELISDQPYFVHRSLAGVTHFKALILSKLSRVKDDGEKSAKILVFAIDQTDGKVTTE